MCVCVCVCVCVGGGGVGGGRWGGGNWNICFKNYFQHFKKKYFDTKCCIKLSSNWVINIYGKKSLQRV